MECVVNWIPLKIRVLSRNTQPQLNPSKNQRKVLVPTGQFHFRFIPVSKKSDRIIQPSTFRKLDEVCAEVPEDSQVFKVRRSWFPTSDRLQTWLIPSERPGLDNSTNQP